MRFYLPLLLMLTQLQGKQHYHHTLYLPLLLVLTQLHSKQHYHHSLYLPLLLVLTQLQGSSSVGIFTSDASAKAAGHKLTSWSYEPIAEDGPNSWGTRFMQCGDLNQSPVDISYNGSEFAEVPPLQFDNWEKKPTSHTILNNGHTVAVSLNPEKNQTLYGGGLAGFYIFAQYHFHWGSDDTKGSEHTFNNFRFPLELHLVFYNSRYETFGGLEEAAQHKDGLAVVTVLFRKAAKDNPVLTPLVNKLRKLKRAVSMMTTSATIPLLDLVPRDVKRFFRYSGSLTTPTCNVAVTWTLLEHTVPVSHSQLEVFRDLEDENGSKVKNNFRPPQPLNGRKILRSFK